MWIRLFRYRSCDPSEASSPPLGKDLVMVVVSCSFTMFLVSGARDFCFDFPCVSVNDVPNVCKNAIDLVISMCDNESCDYDYLEFAVHFVDLLSLAKKNKDV